MYHHYHCICLAGWLYCGGGGAFEQAPGRLALVDWRLVARGGWATEKSSAYHGSTAPLQGPSGGGRQWDWSASG